MEMPDIGRIVQYHRKRARLSRERLSKLSGVSASAIYGIEKGKQTVRMNTLIKVLRALNISIRVDGPLVREYRERIRSAG